MKNGGKLYCHGHSGSAAILHLVLVVPSPTLGSVYEDCEVTGCECYAYASVDKK